MGREAWETNLAIDLWYPELQRGIALRLDPRNDGATLKQYLAVVRTGAHDARHHHGHLIMFERATRSSAHSAARSLGLMPKVPRFALGYNTVMSEGPSAEMPAVGCRKLHLHGAMARPLQ